MFRMNFCRVKENLACIGIYSAEWSSVLHAVF